MPHDHPMSGIKAQFVLPGQTAPDNQSHLALAKVAQSLSVQIITEIPWTRQQDTKLNMKSTMNSAEYLTVIGWCEIPKGQTISTNVWTTHNERKKYYNISSANNRNYLIWTECTRKCYSSTSMVFDV